MSILSLLRGGKGADVSMCPYYKARRHVAHSKKNSACRHAEKSAHDKTWICIKPGTTWVPTLANDSVPCEGNTAKCVSRD